LYSGVVRTNPLERLVEFLNTLDVESGIDALESLDSAALWFAHHGATGPAPGRADLLRARHLRAALRAAAKGHHHEPGSAAPADLDALADDLPVSVNLDADRGPVLRPRHAGARGCLEQLLADAVTAAVAGTWDRLKICPDDTCQWAFVDTSRNLSRRWCSMDDCGNKVKTRAYRRRQTGAGTASTIS
jgi:predicted RNA-binding Zn ribbon-like protein